MSEATRKVKTSWDGHYMADAFFSFVSWSLSDPGSMSAYRSQTGDNWRPGTTPLDRMIDEAVGADLKFIQSFCDWCEGQFGTPADLEEPA